MADLLTLVPGNLVEDVAEEILLLDRFYISTRYPDSLPGSLEDGIPNAQEAQEALNLATRVVKSIGTNL